MNPQEQFWSGEGGTAYLQRNRVDWRARIPFWKEILDWTGARSCFELGCNSGWNLSAIRRCYPDVRVYGSDINPTALRQAHAAGLTVQSNDYLGASDHAYDLTFTAGMLIHVAPENLQATMAKLVRASGQYVLAVEYEAPEEQEVQYRGQQGLLWRRPFGKLYQDMGLKLVTSMPAQGFDRCTAWLLERP